LSKNLRTDPDAKETGADQKIRDNSARHFRFKDLPPASQGRREELHEFFERSISHE
jgi:hypothetical protein